MSKVNLLDNVKLYFTVKSGLRDMDLSNLSKDEETLHWMLIDTVNTNYTFTIEPRKVVEPQRVKMNFFDEDEFFNASEQNKKEYLNDIASIKDFAIMKYAISKSPYVLSDILGGLEFSVEQTKELVDIATENGVSIYDLVDKGSKISNDEIINIAVRNNPRLILELNDMPEYQDLISAETFVVAFAKNPSVLISDCKALKTPIKLKGIKKDGTEGYRTSNLRAQCLRALNLYYRPQAYKENGFDAFAKSIADVIGSNLAFSKALSDRKLLTRSITLANECIKGDVSRSKYLPAQTFKLNNNKVLFTVPSEIRKARSKGKDLDAIKTIILDFLKNQSLATFAPKTKEKLARRCVEICPEIYFELKNIPQMAETAQSLTVQMSALKQFKARKQDDLKEKLFAEIGEERAKKVEARNKANETRRKNNSAPKKFGKKSDNEEMK